MKRIVELETDNVARNLQKNVGTKLNFIPKTSVCS